MKYFIASCVLIVGLAVASKIYATSPLPESVNVTSIVVEKNRHLMILYNGDKVLRTYHVALGRGDSAAKQREGDNRTPEGRYVIDARNEHSPFYKSLHISYPSAADLAHAKTLRVSAGGAVMIHGLRNDLKWLGPLHRMKDWTRGCIAVTNSEMDELWQMVDVGTPIEIRQ